jgi:Ser/Thr protein kinase RdoA (MazF antagonist)
VTLLIDGLEIVEHIATSQNVVLKVSMGGESLVLRLTSPKHRSTEALQVELDLLDDLQSVTRCAIPPRRFRSGRLIEPIRYKERDYNAALFPFIEGPHVAVSSLDAASRFGELLAELHLAFEALGPRKHLPTTPDVLNPHRIIHGDFNTGNVIQAESSFVVIDFEAVRYSTYEFELANAIYMRLFEFRHAIDALIGMDFVRGFLAGYTRQISVAGDQIRTGIDTRVSMLETWLLEPATAPLVIATSSREWKGELANFVRAYGAGRFHALLHEVSDAAEC